MDVEQWKDVCGYVGLYQISNQRRIKSIGKSVQCPFGQIKTRREMLLFNGATDRKTVVLYNSSGIRKAHKIDDLFREAFNDEVQT